VTSQSHSEPVRLFGDELNDDGLETIADLDLFKAGVLVAPDRNAS